MRISDWSSDVCSSDLCGAGFDPDAFWRQTPRSYQSAMRGAAIRARIDGEKDIALAHTIASFSRAKKLERSEEHTSELQSLMRISYAVFCLKKKTTKQTSNQT